MKRVEQVTGLFDILGPGPVETPGDDRIPDPLPARTRPPTTIPYSPPLDGLRAVAVGAVFLYHGGFSGASGGFLGVDAFFVLSGYLITRLLISEWDSSGTIALGAFWLRRARRLLPALLIVLGAVAVYATWLAPADTLHQIRMDSLYTLGYLANWNQIFANQGYFAQSALPSPLLHTWSLAIEEQFYWIWPVVVLGLLRWKRTTRVVLVVAVVGAAASALEMALLFHPGTDPSRLYYGTDTRAQTILVGAVLALLLNERRRAPTATGSTILGGLGVAAVGAFSWMVVAINSNTAWMYRGGFLLFAAITATLIWSFVEVPRGPIARLLSLAPVCYLGLISYGIYLWHWPVDIVVDSPRTGLMGWHLLLLRFVITLTLAVASYHLVERPIRVGGLRAWWSPITVPVVVASVVVATLAATLSPSQNPSTANLGAGAAGIHALPPGHHAVNVLVVGDSMAYLLARQWAKTSAAYGVNLENYTTIGCGLAVTGLVREKDQVISDLAGGYVGTSCARWPQTWASDVAQFNPDVVVLFEGPFEVRDHFLNGRWTHIGDPTFTAFEGSQLSRAVSVLSARGARVTLFTTPYFDQGQQPNGTPWPEDDPHRVDQYNSLLARIATEHPGTVSVIDFGRLLSPNGRYAASVAGVPTHDSGGVHLTPAAYQLVAPRVLPELLALGVNRPTG